MNDWRGKLSIGSGWVYYDGPVGHTEFHQHYAVQICFPFSGPLHIETLENTQTVDGILVIGSNVSHRLSGAGQTAKLLYIEPNLTPHHLSRLTVGGLGKIALSKARMHDLQNALSVAPTRMGTEFGQNIVNLIWPQNSDEHTMKAAPLDLLDPRISKALATIKASDDLNIRLEQLVAGSGLSASRFRHVFSSQVGMSFKSYLLWAKLQRAFGCLATDSSLTKAAHIAGFSDSAHLSRTFRRMFGLAPGDLNKNAEFTTRNPQN
jgi:AraC family transcriptional regulator